jgi:hypothetical protein
VLIHYDWACYVSRMFLLPGETCEAFEQAAIVLTWLAFPFGAAGLVLMGRFRAGITPIVQRVCFWSVIMIFSVGTVVNLGYTLLPRESTTFPPTAAALLLYAPVAFLVVIIVMFGMVRRPRSPGGAR